jgi:eukaryotic-like serine/threonine-protein kinase
MQPGTRLGPYEILAPIGAGGMGEVYRARDTRLGREVAIKVLPPEYAADPERLRRFEQEARAVAALNHPNIVAIHDVGSAPLLSRAAGEESRGAGEAIDRAPGAPGSFGVLRPPQDDSGVVHYLVTELLEGESLRERLQGGALAPRKVVEIAVQVCSGLAAAHEKGVVHRDVKPENLFVTSDGHVKILDFGVAKLRTAHAEPAATPTVVDATEPGVVVGTVAYMSPEQVRGVALDHRSDIFSLGCVLYEMLTGRRPFVRDTAADTMSAILKEEPAEVSAVQPGVPPPLAHVVNHCLEKRPEERFQSARDLAYDLQTHSGSGSTASVSAAGAAGVDGRRRWLVALATGCAGVLVGVGSLLVGRFTAPRPEPPKYTLLTFQRGSIQNARFTADGASVLYSASWEGRVPEVFETRTDLSTARALGLSDVSLQAVSRTGELAVRRQVEGGRGRTGRWHSSPLPGSLPVTWWTA